MTRSTRGTSDPIEREIELALSPRSYIPDGICFSFVNTLHHVEAMIDRLVATDPSRAAALYESFLAACYLKIEELDDSSGRFGMFVDGLYCGWVQARQAEGAEPNETAARLLDWIVGDDYGLCHRLETSLARVFDSVNLAAFVKLVRERFDAAARIAQEGPPRPRAPPLRTDPAHALRRPEGRCCVRRPRRENQNRNDEVRITNDE